MAQHLEVYCGAGDEAKAGGEEKELGRFQKTKKNTTKKGAILIVEGNKTEEVVQVI